MSEINIFERIEMGDDSCLELKHVIVRGEKVLSPDSRSMADELTALANSNSGTIVLGVDDRTREVIPMSVAVLNVVETWVRNICNDIVDPPLDCVISKVRTGDGEGILRVDVPQSVFVHKGGHGYFTRIGSSKRELGPEALARLFQQKSQTRIVCFDEQVVAQAKLEDISPALYRRFRTSLSDSEDISFIRKLHFATSDSQGILRPTVGGILMACEHPELFLPSAYIQAVAYRGVNRTASEQLDSRDITGPLDQQIENALRFVRRNMRMLAVKDPGRIDIPQYSLASVFEAIVNAVAHRDYSIRGSKIRLQMFSDRIELYSPGGLPNSLKIEEMHERQFARNELLCSVLSRCRLTDAIQNIQRQTIMDRRGEGVPIIYKEGEKYSLKRPKYKLLSDSELLLTIYAAPADNPAELLRIARNSTEELTDKESRVLGLIRRNASVTQKQMADACGVSRATIANLLKRMKTSGRVRREGSDRDGLWVIEERMDDAT